MKVLLVDDSKAIAMAVGDMLRQEGYEVVRGIHGQDAIEKLQEEKNIDIILLDWNMPEMDGLEFLKYNIEHEVAKCPIIMMTTENKPEKIMLALDHGAVEYIMKPFTQDILVSKIESVLNKEA